MILGYEEEQSHRLGQRPMVIASFSQIPGGVPPNAIDRKGRRKPPDIQDCQFTFGVKI